MGCGLLNDPATVRAMSRSGRSQELLYGPTQYGLVFVFATIFYWRSTVGLVALMTLCFGDAAAEILGREIGGALLPWSKHKTYAGTLGFFAASLLSVVGLSTFLLDAPSSEEPSFGRLSLVCVLVALAESLSTDNVDNLVIFAAAALSATYLL